MLYRLSCFFRKPIFFHQEKVILATIGALGGISRYFSSSQRQNYRLVMVRSLLSNIREGRRAILKYPGSLVI